MKIVGSFQQHQYITLAFEDIDFIEVQNQEWNEM
jgi:hypothetical protein